jgi:hypothetical protein
MFWEEPAKRANAVFREIGSEQPMGCLGQAAMRPDKVPGTTTDGGAT